MGDPIRHCSSLKMRLLLIATSLALVAAAPHSEDRQKWRPAQGRDLSKYKPKLPEGAFGTPTPTAPRTKPLEFKKGNKSFAEECGLENPNGVEDRIVGGHEAAHHEWPWQVALFVDDAWFCGGSLISDEWVMTAAHCADGAGYFDVMAGAHNVRASSEPHRIEITSFEGQTHPDWDSNSLYADYYGSLIYSGIMCIDAAGGKGVCNGDSGGTLNIRQTEGGNKWTQVG